MRNRSADAPNGRRYEIFTTTRPKRSRAGGSRQSATHHGLVPDPLEGGGFVPEALHVEPVLAADQLDVLMRYPELLGIAQQGESMLRILGQLLEVDEKARSLHGE